MKKRIALFLAATMTIAAVAAGCGTPKPANSSSAPAPESAASSAAATDVSSTPAGETITIKLAHVALETTPIHKGTVKFKELLEEKSGGRFKVEIFPNSSMGGNRELIEQMQFGTLEMCTPSAAFLGGFTDKTALFDLPYLFKSSEAAWKVFDSEVGQTILADLQSAGLIGIDWYAMGWRNTTANKEIKTPADFKGQKIRVMENQMHIDHFNTLGASAIPMAFSEVYTSLQQGVIDAQENPYSQIESQRFYEVQKYLIETKHIYDPVPLLASKTFWDKLSPEDQQLIRDCSKEALQYERGIVNEIDDAIKAEFIKNKSIAIVELSDEERAAFREAAQPVYDNWSSKIGAELIQKAEALQDGM